MNGFLFTADGKLICEVLESVKISPDPYKDRRIVKIQCVNCRKVRKVQKWRFDSAYGPSSKEKYFECKRCHAMTLFQIRGLA